MARKKKRRYTAKTRGRIMLFFAFFGAIILTLSYNLFLILKQVNDLELEKKKLAEEKVNLKEEESAILADIKRLSDSSYVARYAREKFFYSKEGEIILRIDEKN